MTKDFNDGFTSGLDAAISAARSVLQEMLDDANTVPERELLERIHEGFINGMKRSIALIKEVE